MMTEIEKYVTAIMDSIYNKNDLDQILFDVTVLADHLGYDTAIGMCEEIEKKKRLIVEELEKVESSILKQYLLSLINKDDLWLFDSGHFKLFSDGVQHTAKKIISFNLTTAIQLKPDDMRELSQKLSKKTERKVVIDLVVAPSIVGGAIIKKDNYILDYSINTKLINLTLDWKKAIKNPS